MIYILIFLVHLTGTLTIATRLVGVRTKMLAVSISMFNFLSFFYRTTNGFQAPFLAKYIESNLNDSTSWDPYGTFVWLMLLASVATAIGIFLIPTTQRFVTKIVVAYSSRSSFTYLGSKLFQKRALVKAIHCFALPSKQNISQILRIRDLPWKLLIINLVTTGFLTVGVLSAIFSGYLNPEYRTTAATLSFVINGIAAILLYVFVDPPLGVLTDKAIQGSVGEPYFRRVIIWFGITRLAGTFLAQLLLIPLAKLIAIMATMI